MKNKRNDPRNQDQLVNGWEVYRQYHYFKDLLSESGIHEQYQSIVRLAEAVGEDPVQAIQDQALKEFQRLEMGLKSFLKNQQRHPTDSSLNKIDKWERELVEDMTMALRIHKEFLEEADQVVEKMTKKNSGAMNGHASVPNLAKRNLP